MNRLVCFIVLIVAAMLAGCTTHAPSASKFMNVKPHTFAMGLGSALVAGDYYDYVVQRDDDGHDSYTEINFMLDGVAYGREEHFLLGVALETSLLPSFTAGFVSDYLGVQTWVTPFVFDTTSLPNRPFGIMLIEQYPITPNFKVGVSQFFSNNSYAHGDSPDCCSLSVEFNAEFYKEIGAGAYMTYKNFSFEFRYGNELNSGNDRFYFDINLMFDVITSQKKMPNRL